MKSFHHASRDFDTPQGFTVVELLVSIFIIGLLMALIAPAVQSSRAAARLVECSSHLRQIGIATHSYEESNRQLPYTHLGPGFIFYLLPYFDQAAEQVRLEKLMSGSDAERAEAFSTAKRFTVLHCPDDVDVKDNGNDNASYLLNGGLPDFRGQVRGFFPLTERALSWRDVSDGLSQTALCSETCTAPPNQQLTVNSKYGFWLLPTVLVGSLTASQVRVYADECLAASRNTTPAFLIGGDNYAGAGRYDHVNGPNGPSCSDPAGMQTIAAKSNHRGGGVNVLMADGAVKFASSTIDLTVWRAVGSRDGGEVEANSF